MTKVWKILLVIVVLMVLGLYGHRLYSRHFLNQQLDLARSAFADQQYSEAIRRARLANTWYALPTDEDESRLIQAASHLALSRIPGQTLGIGRSRNRSQAVLLLEQITTREHFPDAAELLCEYFFFDQQRFRKGEQYLDAGLRVAPAHPGLLQLRLQILTLTGRWLEACEQVPVAELKQVPAAERLSYLGLLTCATFLPDRFLLNLDRRLGILGSDEMPSDNTALERWSTLATPDYSPPHAAVSLWYQAHGLPQIARQRIQQANSAAQGQVPALVLEQFLALQAETGTVDQEILKRLQEIASPARWAHAQWRLKLKPLSSEEKPWPLPLAPYLPAQLHPPSAETREDETRPMDYGDLVQRWTVDDRQQLVQACEEPGSYAETLQKCWTEFGRDDIAGLLRE